MKAGFKVENSIHTNPKNTNFIIVCNYISLNLVANYSFNKIETLIEETEVGVWNIKHK